ncbi:MAG TPA: hypothetical protein VNA25_04870 [Phycisphaerae bacterium]|nr:hypothetical protein [Phycisphaerae bacterium]
MASKGTKRILLIADLHCGHRVGLTPPGWQYKEEGWSEKWRQIQAECWKWWVSTITRLRPFYAALVLGDLIDGASPRSGGTEAITTDRQTQVDMAIKALSYVHAPNWNFVRGTPYHAGDAEDWEDRVAGYFEAQANTDVVKIGDHDSPEIADTGLVFDIKHEPKSKPREEWTKANGLGKEDLENMVWAEAAYRPRADIILRAHMHRYIRVEGCRPATGRPWTSALLPALQAMGTKYGARRCSVLVDYGLAWVDVEPDGRWQWNALVAHIKSQAASTTLL